MGLVCHWPSRIVEESRRISKNPQESPKTTKLFKKTLQNRTRISKNLQELQINQENLKESSKISKNLNEIFSRIHKNPQESSRISKNLNEIISRIPKNPKESKWNNKITKRNSQRKKERKH